VLTCRARAEACWRVGDGPKAFVRLGAGGREGRWPLREVVLLDADDLTVEALVDALAARGRDSGVGRRSRGWSRARQPDRSVPTRAAVAAPGPQDASRAPAGVGGRPGGK
jgi:hypothetical protein